ncbi:protein FAR1-RELATED SEQUENCE 5 [Triticum aestivum]|uniref:protein FAR1-RELATED SEQUENCE 5 n=1 Tax=Triticum aestivum TaxID=4565 RepID=UPI001D012732|nr:protein FAR1-RELATED SEQUENCE 5-like [Triticum aestivum]XP_044400062.1 protein FAR1-RELATED SEQUENCE 5-like [Triticum aestivum]
MDAHHVSIEEIEEYYMVVSQTFTSEEQGFEFYNKYAKAKGFSVRKANVKNKGGIRIQRLYMCNKEGYRSLKNFERSNRKRKPRALSRCGCDAQLQIELNMETREWFVKDFVDQHNHEFTKPDQTPFLWSHRGLNDPQKADAIEYGIGGLRTHQIMDVMEKQHGGYDKVGCVSRDLYNFIAEYKKQRIEGFDAQYMLNYMAAQEERDSEFFYRYSTDSKGHLQNLFWSDAQSRLDYDAFGGVVVFDSTYRVNKYNLPFVPFIGLNHHRSTVVFGVGIVSDETVASYKWLLHSFLEAMHQNHPRSVITDGDHAMARAILQVWPNTDHRLCSWHIEQNMVRYLRNPKLSDFRKLIYRAFEVDEFERGWLQFNKHYGITEKDTWICRMYELRKKWSAAYTKGRYFLGMRSNQRSESLNSTLHVQLDRRMRLIDLLQHHEHCISVMRRNEAAMDAVASQTVPFTELTADPLEKNASYIYTPIMFEKVKGEIVRLSKWQVEEVNKEDSLTRFAVVHKERRQVRFDVRCVYVGSVIASVHCQCRKMESEDIPCTHIFAILKCVGLDTIPSCCVAKRWTMKAKPAFDSDMSASTQQWSERMDRFHELRNDASVAFFKASKSAAQSERVMAFLNSIIDEGENDENTNIASFGPLPAYFSGARQTFTTKVLDPIPIIPKGAPSKGRLKPFQETMKKKKPKHDCGQSWTGVNYVEEPHIS